MNPTHGYGTSAAWNGHAIGSVNSIGDVSIAADTVEVTTYQSPDAYKEYILGMLDAGEINIGGYLDPEDTNGQIAFLADMNSRTGRNLVITLPAVTGVAWTIPGLPTGFTTGQPVDNKITYSLKIKPTGKPTLAVATSAGLTTPFFALSESAVVTPNASGSVYTYVASVLTGVTSITVTPTATAGTITVNGNTVATGEASSAIALGAAGSVTPITVVVTETNKAPKTYTIYVSRAAA